MHTTNIVHVAYDNPFVVWFWVISLAIIGVIIITTFYRGFREREKHESEYEYDNRFGKWIAFLIFGVIMTVLVGFLLGAVTDYSIQREAVAEFFACHDLLQVDDSATYDFACVAEDRTFMLANLGDSNFVVVQP